MKLTTALRIEDEMRRTQSTSPTVLSYAILQFNAPAMRTVFAAYAAVVKRDSWAALPYASRSHGILLL